MSNTDTNGCGETADYAVGNCADGCGWEEDGDPMTILDAAQAHANATGHTVNVDCTMGVTVEPD